MTEKADQELRDFFRRCCEQIAAANVMTYEQVVAELEAGRAAAEIHRQRLHHLGKVR